MRKAARFPAVLILPVALACTGCGAVPGIASARRGDFEVLRVEVEKHDYSSRQVRKLARAVLAREVEHAVDLADRAFIASLESCAQEVAGALRKRASGEDGLAAEAALVLLEAHLWNKSTKRYRQVEDGAWRALAARSTQDEAELRRRYFEDEDQRVRRAALSAALEAKDEGDVAGLLEVARLDPDPLSRSRAFQALGFIGGKSVAQALLDRYEQADEELRLAIVAAWGEPALYRTGGRVYLERLLTHQTGLPSVVAASRLSRDESGSVANPAVTRLVRFTREGTTDERRLALQLMPLTFSETSSALLEATKAEDRQVVVIAWARLLSHPAQRSAAEAALSVLARSEEDTRLQARAALAAAGSGKARPLLVQQSADANAESRKVAARGLVRLGAFEDLPPVLADPDATVRRETACLILARPETPLQN